MFTSRKNILEAANLAVLHKPEAQGRQVIMRVGKRQQGQTVEGLVYLAKATRFMQCARPTPGGSK